MATTSNLYGPAHNRTNELILEHCESGDIIQLYPGQGAKFGRTHGLNMEAAMNNRSKNPYKDIKVYALPTKKTKKLGKPAKREAVFILKALAKTGSLRREWYNGSN